MYRPRRVLIQIAMFLFVLSVWSGLCALANAIGSRHASCCHITPHVQVELERLANEGVIDVDRAAASLELHAWSDPQAPAPNTFVEPREVYLQRVTGRLASVVAETPAEEWTFAKESAAQSHAIIAAICLVGSIVVAFRAIRTPKHAIAATPLPNAGPKAEAEGV